MDPLAVDAQLLRAVLTPELNLSVGRIFSVRVAELFPNGRGMLSLAGVLLEAELPAGIEAGQELRLQVREVTPERVVLGLHAEAPPAPGEVPPGAVPLPGGGAFRVTRHDQEGDDRGGGSEPGGSGDRHLLALTYDAPALGAVEMQFALDRSGLRVVLTLAAGQSFELAQDASGRLRSALGDAVALPVSVTVVPRREPVDLYA